MKYKLDKEIEAVAYFGENGYVLFREDLWNNSVVIELYLKKLSPGKHGFHIHEAGDLREGCQSLCAHYNPFNSNHGDRSDAIRHLGDLGNININENGISHEIIVDDQIKLRGKYSIIGRSLIIHEKEDDVGKGGDDESLKTGNSGKRIACAIIGYSKNC